MTQDEKMLVSVPDRAAALRVGKAILEAHGAWETENVMHGGQAPWCEQHCILLGQAAMLEALSAAPAQPASDMAEILRAQLNDQSRYLNPAHAQPAPAEPELKRGDRRIIDGKWCEFIEREIEGDKWAVIGDAQPAAVEGAALSASDRACYEYPGEDQAALRAAFVAGACFVADNPPSTPALDEGGAGEPVAWRWHHHSQPGRWQVTTDDAVTQDPYCVSAPLYAHPSPTPAADADRVRIAVEDIQAKINAPLTGPTHGAWDRGRIAGLKEALAALKSSEVEKMSAQRRDLIKRLAKAECGSRELDKAIFEATSPPAEYAEWSPRLRGYQYTTSIDAALSWAEWVLPGQEWRFGSGTRDTTLPWARIGRWAEPDAVGATPALAICGAILIALNRAEIEATRSPSATLAALKSTAAKEGGE